MNPRPAYGTNPTGPALTSNNQQTCLNYPPPPARRTAGSGVRGTDLLWLAAAGDPLLLHHVLGGPLDDADLAARLGLDVGGLEPAGEAGGTRCGSGGRPVREGGGKY